MRTRLLLRVLSVVGVIVAALGAATPVMAANELGLSSNGTTWSATLPAPLFDPAFRWVPGDVEESSFYVRNQGSETGVLRVAMMDTAVRSLMDSGDLEVAARVGTADWVTVTTAGAQLLVEGEQIPASGVRRVDVRVSFAPLSQNASQAQRFDLGFDVSLSQDTSVLPPTNGGGDGNGNGNGDGNGSGTDNNGNLPGTGSTISRGLLLLAVTLCAGGLGLVGFGRRDRQSKERQTPHA